MLPKTSYILLIFANLIMTLLVGCGSKSVQESFVRPDTDLGFVRSVAILPFENNSQDRFVAERLRDVTTTQMLSRNLFEIIEKGVVDGALAEESVTRDTPIDGKIMKRLGQRLGVQALFLGIIDNYGEARKGSYSYPELAMTFRLVEANSAKILWQVSGRRKGETFGGRLFGTSPEDDFQVALNLSRQMLQSLTEEPQAVPEKPSAPQAMPTKAAPKDIPPEKAENQEEAPAEKDNQENGNDK